MCVCVRARKSTLHNGAAFTIRSVTNLYAKYYPVEWNVEWISWACQKCVVIKVKLVYIYKRCMPPLLPVPMYLLISMYIYTKINRIYMYNKCSPMYRFIEYKYIILYVGVRKAAFTKSIQYFIHPNHAHTFNFSRIKLL